MDTSRFGYATFVSAEHFLSDVLVTKQQMLLTMQEVEYLLMQYYQLSISFS